MKKNLILLFIILLCSCSQKNEMENTLYIPIEIKDIQNILEEKKDLNKKVITYEELQEDIDWFIYLLETSYIGYTDALERGLDVNLQKKQVLNILGGQATVETKDFLKILYMVFKPYIKDYHSTIYFDGQEFRFIEPMQTFFSNVFVKKIDDNFIVYDSDVEDIKKGDAYNSDLNQLLLYPSKGENIYRIGGVFSNYPNSIKIKINNNDVEIPVFLSLEENKDFSYLVKETKDSIYIKYNRCTFENTEELEYLNKFSNSAALCMNKKYLILDVRGNYGGDDYYGRKFLSELYKTNDKILQPSEKWIYSPANTESFYKMLYEYTDVRNPEIKAILKELKHYKKIFKKDAQKIITESKMLINKKDDPDYKGVIILLSDSGVASSGEDIISLSKYLFSDSTQVYQIGNNTAGCQAYGNICRYYLPNSGIKIILPMTDYSELSKKSLSYHGEGNGFYPDFWSSRDDLNDTVYFITHDDELKNILKDIL